MGSADAEAVTAAVRETVEKKPAPAAAPPVRRPRKVAGAPNPEAKGAAEGSGGIEVPTAAAAQALEAGPPGDAGGRTAPSSSGAAKGQGEATVAKDFAGVSREMRDEMAAFVREQFADTASTTQRLMKCTSLGDAMAVQVEASVRTVGRLFARGQTMTRLGQDMLRSFGPAGRARH